MLALQDGDESSDTINAIFRAVHSIKGGAGAFNLTEVVRLAHEFETTLDLLRNGELVPTPDHIKLLLRAADVLNDVVVASRDGTDFDLTVAHAMAGELRAINETVDSGSSEDESVEEIAFEPVIISFDDEPETPVAAGPTTRRLRLRFKPKRELYTSANDPFLIIRELAQAGEMQVRCDCSQLPMLDRLDPMQGYLIWIIELETARFPQEIREIFEFVDDLCELTIDDITGQEPQSFDAEPEISAPLMSVTMPPSMNVAPPTAAEPEMEPAMATAKQAKPTDNAEALRAGATGAPATIRVDLERVDRLINLVGELVINQAMLSQRVEVEGIARSSAFAVGLDDLEQLTREIQDSVMAIRAQPVKPLFQRMSRITREIAEITGKSVRLKTEGEATEVDKTVIERLADPLTHMIRNAVDHGLESPEARIAAGKPSEGQVRLSAAHRSGRIVIEVADDGAGINRARVREIAVKKGIISADAVLSDGEIENLLFAPGFSTAATVSNISGRGVGMDVVKRSIQALGGRISISSTPGAGTTFSMSLPLTLAVLDGMVVAVNQQTVVVPLTAIIETLKPKSSDIHELPRSVRRLIFSRGEFIPLIEIGKELGFGPGLADPTEGVAVLVETEGGVRAALLVDAIHDQRQVVIKSLEENYGRVEGIAAATILGTGRVALILDVDAVVSRGRSEAAMKEPLTFEMG